MKPEHPIMLEVKALRKYYPVKTGVLRGVTAHVKAVDGISFYINEGETLGLVGESGCGKSTTGTTIIGLEKPTSGEIIFEGQSTLNLNKVEQKQMRKQMQMIFQDPYSSLNPRMTVAEIVGEPLIIHGLTSSGKEHRERVEQLLNSVGLSKSHMDRYPHEFSGGQRQRIGIARALAVNPKLIIADEPVSALDVSVQAQVVNLFMDLQSSLGLTYLFIAHDLSVIKHISHRVAVMYLGKIVEMAEKTELYNNPFHPYTQSLLAAVPIPDPFKKKQRFRLEGDVPSSLDLPQGCRFYPRCRLAMDICRQEEPVFAEYSDNHYVACHLMKGGNKSS